MSDFAGQFQAIAVGQLDADAEALTDLGLARRIHKTAALGNVGNAGQALSAGSPVPNGLEGNV